MSNSLICSLCGKKIEKFEVWLLKDINNFTNRKLIFGICSKCKSPRVILQEKRISDGKLFADEHIFGKNIPKVLMREKLRLVSKLFELPKDNLAGFIYGVNKEIRYKKTTKLRQYSCDLKTNNKVKCKEITLRK